MATSAACLLERLLANGKFWLKRARIDAAHLVGDTPPAGPDGALLADVRVERGRIRAVLPAGESPCCAPGLCLDGGDLRPLDAAGRIGPGEPADLSLVPAGACRIDVRDGHVAADTGNR